MGAAVSLSQSTWGERWSVDLSSSDARYPHAAFPWIGFDDAPMITVCCKVTYDLVAGTATVADTQIPLSRQEQHWGNDAARSVFMPNDLVPMKPHPEVMLVGSAHAPRGTSVRGLDVKLVVGSWSKSLRVVGDRNDENDGLGKPFTSMPLLYERAAGGPNSSNPVGIAESKRRWSRPNIEAIDPGGTPGFGPLASFWPRKPKAAGDARRDPRQGPSEHRGNPDGFSPDFFQSAPPDQWLSPIEGPWPLELIHLHPAISTLETELRPFAMQATEVRPGTTTMVNLAPDTLWIYPDRAIATLTYRASMAAHGDMKIALGVVTEAPSSSRPPSWPLSSAPSAERTHPRAARAATVELSLHGRDVPASGIMPSFARARQATPPPALVSAASFATALPLSSALEASNRAADPTAVETRIEVHPPRHREALSLLWFDAPFSAALRGVPSFRDIIRRAEQRETQEGRVEATPAEDEDRRDHAEVIREGAARSIVVIDDALRTWVGGSGGTKPAPLLLVEATLSVMFDAGATLRALIGAARPFGKADAELARTIDEVTELQGRSDDLTPSHDLAAAARMLRDAFASATRAVPATYLDEQSRRTLVERRAYREVSLWGGTFVPIEMSDPGGAPPQPTRVGYLPKEAAMRLPLLATLDVKALVEALPAEEPGDTFVTFRVRALARKIVIS